MNFILIRVGLGCELVWVVLPAHLTVDSRSLKQYGKMDASCKYTENYCSSQNKQNISTMHLFCDNDVPVRAAQSGAW